MLRCCAGGPVREVPRGAAPPYVQKLRSSPRTITYWLVAARWVPVKAYWITEDWFCSALPAPLGSVSVTRIWSVEPAVSALRFESARLEPTTGVEAGAEPPSVHATEHLSIAIWRPLVVSVFSSELVVALVVSETEARLIVPWLMRSTLRWMVSPAAMFEAPTVSRLVDAPVAPRPMVTVPDATDWLAEVELVKVAYVPRPAMAAAAPMAAMESSSFRDTPDSAERAIKREVLSTGGGKMKRDCRITLQVSGLPRIVGAPTAFDHPQKR